MDDEQQFCLKWNNHQSTLVSVFDSLLRRNQLLDCTLAAEGRSLKAHKVILSACSPYFESLLADYYDKHPVFILKDVKFKELEAMMDYMYRGEVNVSQDQLGPLLKAAESLQIKGLSDNRRESRSNNEDRKREPPILPPRERTPPPAPSLPQVKGLVIEQKKVDIMNNREGSQSPGRRKKRRRQSIDADAGNDSSIENHDGASNGSSSVSVSQPIVPPNVPLNDSRSELSAASSVKTKTEENMPQVPLKQKLEPHSELMLEPKSEYIEEDMNDDSIEDLTLDDDELDMDHNRPGPSHGGQGDGSNQGFGWQMDPSQDETFMAAQEAVGQHRDAQDFENIKFENEDETKKIGFKNLFTGQTYLSSNIYIQTTLFDTMLESYKPRVFVKKLARFLFGEHVLKESTVTGNVSNRKVNKNVEKPKQLDPVLVSVIRDVYRYFLRNKKNRFNLTEYDIVKEVSKIPSILSELIADVKRSKRSRTNKNRIDEPEEPSTSETPNFEITNNQQQYLHLKVEHIDVEYNDLTIT